MGRLRALLDDLLGVELTMIGSSVLAGPLRDVERARRLMSALDHRLLSEIDQPGVAGEYARTSTAELRVTML